MPNLNFKGKVFVQNHHLAVPFHELEPVKAKGLCKTPSLHDNLIDIDTIRPRGNEDTEVRLVQIFRKCGITGWRRLATLRSIGFYESR